MRTTNIPVSRSVDDVPLGALVLIPSDNMWAIKSVEGLFSINDRRPSNVNGKVADFGHDYRVSVSLDNLVRASYPFNKNEVPVGCLISFEEDGVISHSILLDIDTRDAAMTVDLSTGSIEHRAHESAEGLAYTEWSLEVRTSEDSYETIYRYPE